MISHKRFGLRVSCLSAVLMVTSVWISGAAMAGPNAGSHDETLMHDGVLRHYRIHIPPGLGEKPVSLVLMLHGRGGNGKGFEQLTGMSMKADREKFLVVYPDALGKPPAWTTGLNRATHNGDDIGFLKALIAKIEHTHKVNPHRIYCAGFSSGANMSEFVGASLSDTIAAIGDVEGCVGNIQDGERHEIPAPNQPVSVIHIHGKLDHRIPYDGGPNPNLPDGVVLSVAEAISFWVKHDGCNPTPTTQHMNNNTILRDTYTGGKQNTEVVLYTLTQGKHEWAKQQTLGISATDRIWEFFEAHPKHGQN